MGSVAVIGWWSVQLKNEFSNPYRVARWMLQMLDLDFLMPPKRLHPSAAGGLTYYHHITLQMQIPGRVLPKCWNEHPLVLNCGVCLDANLQYIIVLIRVLTVNRHCITFSLPYLTLHVYIATCPHYHHLTIQSCNVRRVWLVEAIKWQLLSATPFPWEINQLDRWW